MKQVSENITRNINSINNVMMKKDLSALPVIQNRLPSSNAGYPVESKEEAKSPLQSLEKSTRSSVMWELMGELPEWFSSFTRGWKNRTDFEEAKSM